MSSTTTLASATSSWELCDDETELEHCDFGITFSRHSKHHVIKSSPSNTKTAKNCIVLLRKIAKIAFLWVLGWGGVMRTKQCLSHSFDKLFLFLSYLVCLLEFIVSGCDTWWIFIIPTLSPASFLRRLPLNSLLLLLFNIIITIM